MKIKQKIIDFFINRFYIDFEKTHNGNQYLRTVDSLERLLRNFLEVCHNHGVQKVNRKNLNAVTLTPLLTIFHDMIENSYRYSQKWGIIKKIAKKHGLILIMKKNKDEVIIECSYPVRTITNKDNFVIKEIVEFKSLVYKK